MYNTHMSESDNLTPRQQSAAESIQEDEGLTGDLTDDQARALVRWAGTAAARAAAPGPSDDEAAALVGAVRRAARQAAHQAAPGQDIVALAEAALAEAAPPAGQAPAS